METVSVETVSEIGNSIDRQKNLELSDKQKKRSGKKKRKSRQRESELRNNDSHTSSQNGNADGAFSSEEKKEGKTEKSTSEDQVQLSDNGVSTLPAAKPHHTDPILSTTREDSLPDANRNDSSRKKSKRRKRKKKEDTSCEEKMLDDAEDIPNEGQVHLLNTPLSNGIIQEGSHEHTQGSCEKPGAAQLCTGPNLSARADSQPDATTMTSSKKRKRTKKSDRNALKERDVDIHCTNAEVAVKYNTITEAEGSKSMSKEEKSVASVVINSCLISKDDTVEQQECTDVKLSETVAHTESSKSKRRKKRKTKPVEVCDPLGNTLTTSPQSRPVECVENNDENKETDANTEVKEDVFEVKYDTISEAEGSKLMSKEEGIVASVVISSSLKFKDDTVEQQECTDVKLSETVAQAQSPKAKKRKKRKTKTVEVCDPLGDTLPTSTKSMPVECVENNDGNKETDGHTVVKEDVLEVKYDTISEAEGSKLMSIEEKSIASFVISSCLKSKDDTVEKQQCTDVKLNETVAQTQNPKAKRKKKRKTETMKVCDQLGNTLSTSMKSGPVECVENNDGNGGQELISYSASQSENSVTVEERSFQNPGKTKEKETDENSRKGKEKKTSSADHKTADMEVCEPSESVECLLGHSNEKDMQNCDGNAGQEFGGEDMTSKMENSATREKSGVQKSGKRKEMTKDENIESNQDALGAEGVSDIGRKRQKRKIKSKTNCESVATMDSESVQCLLYQSNREGVKNCDGNADGEIASKDLASNIEDSATKRESVQDVENTKKKKKGRKGEVNQDALGAEGFSRGELTTKKTKKKKNSLDQKTDNMEEDSKKKNDEKGEVDQKALGAEGVSKVEVKTKKSKKKNSFDHKTDDMEEKDDVSLPRKDEEPEFEREKVETSLSSSVLIQNNMAQGVASSETGGVPRCSCEGQRTRKLVVFDLNGILADIVQGFTGQFVPDGKVSYRSVFRRPFVSSFLDFCFERFHVAIWSSRRIGLDFMVYTVMKNYARNLLFCFDQNKCTTTKFKTQEKNDKPLFLKDLRTVWDRFGTCISCGKRKFDETNTLLVDDSPDKALCNPPHTGIFPCPYKYTDRQDSALGPEGELRKYLERLADAENVQEFVVENPFGQTAITETHESWEFYSKVIEAHK